MVARTSTDAIMARASRSDFPAWQRQVERAGRCSQPVRIAGGASAVDVSSGEVRASLSSASAPDGVLLIACGDRRAAVCPSCAEVYRRDMWHLVTAGLSGRSSAPPGDAGAPAGGSGAAPAVSTSVPATVAEHPMVFVTLTAPSFGAVHRRDGSGGRCHPRSGARRCAHGRALGCGLVHGPDHPVVGTPLCAACYDYTGAVLWHAHLGELWRRTRIAIDRALAPLASAALGYRVTAAALKKVVRTSYVKVAEFQKRGVVHLHAVVRLDGVDSEDSSAVVPPPAWASARVLRTAIDQAVSGVSVAMPSPDGVLRAAAWGHQYDVSEISGADAEKRRTGAYVAKYATKTASDVIGASSALARRITRLRRGWLRRAVGAHVARMVETAWNLGGRRDLAHLKLRRWAHTLGFRGHFATKSRAYSVTMGALRMARRQWRARENSTGGQPDVWHSQTEESAVIVGQWRYAGRGYVGSADALLVEAMAREYEETKIEYREQIAREKQLAAEITR